MWIPTLDGLIERRLLVNYRADPEIVAGLLPAPFRPQVVNGHALAGICLIRMSRLRPRMLPVAVLGPTENGALRFAVEWDEGGGRHTGVYIPRRFSTSRFVCAVGGRFFPGIHSRARFRVEETDTTYFVEMSGELNLSVRGTATDEWPGSGVFGSQEEASAFYRGGVVGYSEALRPGRFDGLELRVPDWIARPLAVDHVACDFFDDPDRFPAGTVGFDNALLMRGVKNEFHSRRTLHRPESAVAGSAVG